MYEHFSIDVATQYLVTQEFEDQYNVTVRVVEDFILRFAQKVQVAPGFSEDFALEIQIGNFAGWSSTIQDVYNLIEDDNQVLIVTSEDSQADFQENLVVGEAESMDAQAELQIGNYSASFGTAFAIGERFFDASTRQDVLTGPFETDFAVKLAVGEPLAEGQMFLNVYGTLGDFSTLLDIADPTIYDAQVVVYVGNFSSTLATKQYVGSVTSRVEIETCSNEED